MGISDTIYALSSGGLPSGVAMIRISGTRTTEVLAKLSGKIPAPRLAKLSSIRGRNDQLIDQGLVLFFKGPGSFTGEDCAELQLHGGKAVVEAVLTELAYLGCRHAEAGEFSRRAFQNDKLDLVEIEGLADLIAAETEMQRRLAVEHSSGHLSSLYEGWSRRLVHARAMIEAELDFADEEDVPGSVSPSVWADMSLLGEEIGTHLDGAAVAEIIRDGLNVVIAGAPNAGKSSLLNALAQRDIAIVTEIAGTTRDVLSVDLSLAGFSIKLHDTAGLRETQDLVEKEGIRRARNVISKADLVIALSDNPCDFPELGAVGTIRVGTKIDSNPDLWDKSAADVLISVKTGQGMERLIDVIVSRLPDLNAFSNFALPSRRRHVDCLNEARTAIHSSLAAADLGLDIQAEYLRIAGDALGRITGRVDVEDLLSIIFSEFCVGK
ncbi:tRNA modification GTPase [Pararhizobium capsulatum DSM 1112]|uniref:tRNA modification GTPase MnmE n=1 Tax=Pararhizobium capsulatum DSM 1112 TaxID=1121113 RepID=A0ABU0BIX2_9HYPH|nr:tRNA uridine-5-carboxymethylaminomethyl(34) synthesis GTPase MnmE [Pararhizobium capsulatum]MDQ0318207.1 tRNA modification GTPase [Pararhizobium capsulatum DSM 1112]